ncbi:CAP domain-containing protein [Marinovum sp.]|uniref:CAP domain-containing protein n=1 Tax=Marinovum sp. TaxID=2024839 RepID=UPI002B27ABFC|nr:CAP domain-containing protein [Marinovum sp.]
MTRIAALLLPLVLLLAACTTSNYSPPQLAADGKPLPKVYRLGSGDEGRVQFRMLDAVNALRQARSLPAVQLNAQLNAAAATHARDMSVQNRPWHFGSDGSSPIDRVARVGYQGRMLGEAISETYETELETLAAWMEEPGTRDVIMSPEARDLGFNYYQESNGKIWWTLVLGAPGAPGYLPSTSIATAPGGLQPIEDIAAAAINLSEDDS